MIKDSETKDKILKAARAIFAEKGRDGARMQEIADRAGVNKALLHYYFTSKENLYQEVFMSVFSALAKNLSSLFESKLTFEEHLRRFIRQHLDFLTENHDLPILLMQEATRKDSMLPKIIPRLIKGQAFEIRHSIVEAFDEAVQAGQIRPCDPVHLIINIISMNVFYFVARPVFDTIFPERVKDQQKFLEERKNAITEMVVQGLFIK